MVHLAVESGASFHRQVVWERPDGTRSDLTGFTARMQVRPKLGGSVLVDLSDTSGLVLGDVQGTVRISMTPTQTALLVGRRAFYDLVVISPASEVTRLMEGTIAIDPRITVT